MSLLHRIYPGDLKPEDLVDALQDPIHFEPIGRLLAARPVKSVKVRGVKMTEQTNDKETSVDVKDSQNPEQFSPAQIEFLKYVGIQVKPSGASQAVFNVGRDETKRRLDLVITGLAELISGEYLADLIKEKRQEKESKAPKETKSIRDAYCSRCGGAGSVSTVKRKKTGLTPIEDCPTCHGSGWKSKRVSVPESQIEDSDEIAPESTIRSLSLMRYESMESQLARIRAICSPTQCQQFPVVKEILDICLESGLENNEVERYRELYRVESMAAHDAQVQRDYLLKEREELKNTIRDFAGLIRDLANFISDVAPDSNYWQDSLAGRVDEVFSIDSTSVVISDEQPEPSKCDCPYEDGKGLSNGHAECCAAIKEQTHNILSDRDGVCFHCGMRLPLERCVLQVGRVFCSDGCADQYYKE